MVMSSVELRTVTGESLTLNLPSSNPSVADAVANLRTHHGYAPGVALMFASRVLDNQRYLAEFPDGNIIIAGHPAKQGGYDNRRAQASGRMPSQPSQQSNPTTPQRTAPSPQQQCKPTGAQSPGRRSEALVSPKPQERGSTLWNLTLHVPAKNSNVKITVADDCTVEGALFTATSFDPAFANAKLVFQGKLLSDTPKTELKSFGVHDGSTLMIALGNRQSGANDDYSNPTAVKLFEVEKEFEVLKAPVSEAGGVLRLGDKQRKMFFEDTMKLLYRLDALEGLPPTFRQRRKDLVQAIQTLQDEAGVSK